MADLGPLAACTGLQVLNCRNTTVSDFGPQAACTGLRALYCDHHHVHAAQVQLLQAACSELDLNGLLAGFSGGARVL